MDEYLMVRQDRRELDGETVALLLDELDGNMVVLPDRINLWRGQ